jgi:predicted nucleic acid-binding protein
MKVILDTNIIFSDFHLKGAKIKNLCESVKSTGGSVHIPAIVVDESINKYREKTQECKSKIDKSISDFKRLTGKEVGDSPISDEFISKEAEEYAEKFKKQLQKLGIKIIPYPSISHQELVKRDLARKKPFQESGKGYRDALIWESVKGVCEKPSSLFEVPKIIFVNKNHKDFCEDGLLHPDLKEDLVNNGINEDYIRVIEDIDIFIKEYIKPKQKILKNILDELNANKQYNEIDLNIEIENRATEFLLHREFDYEESPFRQEFENPSVVSVYEPSFTVTDVRQISEEEILVEIEIDIDCEFDFFIFKSDAICMDEDELPYIWNNDWNKHYMAASKTIPVKLKMSLIVDTAFSRILSDDMEIINPEIDYHDGL